MPSEGPFCLHPFPAGIPIRAPASVLEHSCLAGASVFDVSHSLLECKFQARRYMSGLVTALSSAQRTVLGTEEMLNKCLLNNQLIQYKRLLSSYSWVQKASMWYGIDMNHSN